ncbi:MAG: sigma-70 family RNA polymerase sigma factor [Clostridia bacterium]|nr:sigma-70 family RNA polymerase sigma factor [Clostridia bacterium]
MKHHALMYRTALMFVRNLPDAEDIVNSSCESLLRSVANVRTVVPTALPAYIISTVQNEARMLLRRKKRDACILERLYHEAPTMDKANVSEEVIFRRTLLEVKELIRRLAPEDQQVLKMRCFDHLSYEEIAKYVGLTESAVRSRLCRARRRLHTLMEEVDKHGL